MNKITYILVILAALFGLTHTIVLLNSQKKDKQCSDYASSTLSDLPLNCYSYYKINKGCFDIKEKKVLRGKNITTEYEVTPLCN